MKATLKQPEYCAYAHKKIYEKLLMHWQAEAVFKVINKKIV
jgi:hypothetical protein